jgi:hypothetical protein
MRDFIVLRNLANVALETPLAARIRAGLNRLSLDLPLPQLDVQRGLTPRQRGQVMAACPPLTPCCAEGNAGWS